MVEANFPYWPPTSPQLPAEIPGRQMGLEVLDLAVNQIPRGRLDEIPLKPVPVPRTRKPELPSTQSVQIAGIYSGSDLYQYFLQTNSAPREQLVAALMRG